MCLNVGTVNKSQHSWVISYTVFEHEWHEGSKCLTEVLPKDSSDVNFGGISTSQKAMMGMVICDASNSLMVNSGISNNNDTGLLTVGSNPTDFHKASCWKLPHSGIPTDENPLI